MSVNESNTFSYKKAFKDYITEFVMLFAAVTLGFFAENQRGICGETIRASADEIDGC
jgi:hypothetical protein